MNKKGFISISIIYSFLLVFIAIVFSILAVYTSRKLSMIEIQKDVKNLIDSKSNFDCLSNGITNLNECILYKYGGEENIVFKNNFSGAAVTQSGEYGLYKTLDDDGDSYYFRGDVPDNYVRFGKNEEGVDMYWRIVRINGDGTIRMIYDGIELLGNGHVNEDVIIGDELYNTVEAESYAGYKFIDYKESMVKPIVDAWYENNLLDYNNYIADSVFCNDREIAFYDYIETEGTNKNHNCIFNDSDNSKETCDNVYKTSNAGCRYDTYEYEGHTYNYLSYSEVFTSFIRISDSVNKPKLVCNSDDRYNVRNGLTYPIGILTLDEAALAGNKFASINQSNYLYRGHDYWLMTPIDNGYTICYGGSDVWYVEANGELQDTNGVDNDDAKGIRPVINLISTMEIKTGKGTVNSPYILKGVN